MEKMNFTTLKNQIKLMVDTYYLTHEYEQTNDPYPNKSKEEYSDYLGKTIDLKGAWSKNQEKHAFIYVVIFNKLYYRKEGLKLGVTDFEIQDTFNKFIRTIEVYEGFEHKAEFRQYLWQKTLEVFELEKREQKDYQDKTFLRRLLDTDSMLILHLKQIDIVRKDFMRIDGRIRSMLNDWKNKQITGSEMDAIREQLDNSREYFRNKLYYLQEKYKTVSENGHYRRRKLLKNCFSYKELDEANSEAPMELNYKNLTTVKFIVEEYCRWYNKRFSNEIKDANKIAVNRAKQAKRKQLKLNSKQYTQKQERIQLVERLYKEKMSIREIAKQTQLPRSTVNRIVSELKK